ncbi:MAG TPA: glycosyltransferase family 39 protein [Candidatus Obscuribacterales bacterium]
MALSIACFAVYFLGMACFGITDPGEGYYAEAAREMVESGDYITPHLNYQIYFSKPILTFWLMAVPYRIFGVSEFTARISFSIIATILVLGSYLLARRLIDERAGLLAGLIAASSPLLVAITRLSPIDIAFACFLDLAVYSFAAAAILNERRFWPVLFVALALAVLTKGPAGVVLFLIGTVVFLLVERPPWRQMLVWLDRLELGWGSIIFWLLVLPWHLGVSYATNGLFLLVFFFYENLARFAGHTNLAKTYWWYYFPVIAYGFAPWIVLLPPAVFNALKSRLNLTEIRRLFTRRAASEGAASEPKEQVLCYLTLWCITEFAFFTLSKTKMDTYILPTIAPFSIVVAWQISEWARQMEESQRTSKWLWAILFPAHALSVLSLLAVAPIFLAQQFSPLMRFAIALGACSVGAGCTFFVLSFAKRKLLTGFIAFAGSFALAAALITPFAFKYACKLRFDDLQVISQYLRDKDCDIAIFGLFRPASMFYSRKPVDSFFHPHLLEPLNVAEQEEPNLAPGGAKAGEDRKEENSAPENRALDDRGKVEAQRQKRLLIVLAENKFVDRLVSQSQVVLKPVGKRGSWSAFEARDARLRKIDTLERIFSNPVAFEAAVSGKGADWGPLTVPYAGGDPKWWLKSRNIPHRGSSK